MGLTPGSKCASRLWRFFLADEEGVKKPREFARQPLYRLTAPHGKSSASKFWRASVQTAVVTLGTGNLPSLLPSFRLTKLEIKKHTKKFIHENANTTDAIATIAHTVPSSLVKLLVKNECPPPEEWQLKHPIPMKTPEAV
ncbi:hypothetical protein TNCV_3485831 [Trichonephila clavipes]|nr:hypothetical protein TNCV_3485831 [Trichonephila clavipes]